MSFTNVTLVGATGNLGPAILKALLDAGFNVTVLSREGSASTNSLATHPKQRVVKVNFDDTNSITAALDGIDVVVSNVASHALLSQKKIIDACVAAGVKRFIPSDFGSDYGNAANQKVPFLQPKIEVQRYVKETSGAHPELTYTLMTTGPFFDWCLKFGLFGDLKTHEATLWDDGKAEISTTTLASVGEAVVGVLHNPEATKNREIRVADTTISQKRILEIVQEITSKPWTIKKGSTAEAYEIGLAELKKSEANMFTAVFNQLYRVIFSTEHEPNFSDRLDNDKVGIPVMTDAQVKEVIKSCVA